MYEHDVDDDLVRSIDLAAQDPGAIKTFYQLSLAGSRTKVAAGDLLRDYDGALMLLWGEKDPWMTPTKATRIREIKPHAVYSPVAGGHCPHDDCPREKRRRAPRVGRRPVTHAHSSFILTHNTTYYIYTIVFLIDVLPPRRTLCPVHHDGSGPVHRWIPFTSPHSPSTPPPRRPRDPIGA